MNLSVLSTLLKNHSDIFFISSGSMRESLSHIGLGSFPGRYNADGSRVEIPGMTTETCYTASLMKVDEDKRAIIDKPHTGRLLQAGAQVGCNVYYKRYYAGVAYLHDLTPFSRHYSPAGLTSEPKNVGGFTQSSGTNCDMEISTRHNFSITLGYVF